MFAGHLILLPSLGVKQSALLFNWISTCYGLKSISKKFLTVMLITTSIIFIVIISLSDNEAARRLRFAPLLSSSKFPAFSLYEIVEMDHYDLMPTPPMFKHYNLKDHTVSDGFVGERYLTCENQQG